MNTVTADQLDAVLGKPSFWSPIQLGGKMHYLHGIPLFDEVVDSSSMMNTLLNIKLRPNGLEWSITTPSLKMRKTGIPFQDIKSITMESPAEVVVNKERSVIGRALLGGILLGPVGAIIGGVSGLQNGSQVQSSDALLTVVVEQQGVESHFIALVPPASRVEVDNFLKKRLTQFYR